MTRGELLDRIDAREIGEWEAYERVAGPLGAARHDELFAMLMALIANVNRAKSRRPYRTDEFRPRWDPDAPPTPRPQQTPEEMLKAVKKLHRSMTRGEGRKRGDAS